MAQPLAQAKQFMDSAVLKKAHVQIREKSVALFKLKALGQDVTDFERILREGISRSSQKFKA